MFTYTPHIVVDLFVPITQVNIPTCGHFASVK